MMAQLLWEDEFKGFATAANGIDRNSLIEIWKRLQYVGSGQLSYFRTKDGAEVDYIVELEDRTLAIEVKWTDRPSLQDVSGLVSFLRDHTKVAEGYVICRCPRPARLSKSIVALPWHFL